MEIEIYIVDSFTNKPFSGNPAGVCILNKDLKSEEMQNIAKELGLSETAFVIKNEIRDTYSIRFFSPKMEIPLCGHATLAASKVLYKLYPQNNDIHFVNIHDVDLFIQQDEEFIAMEFPAYGTVSKEAPTQLLNALGLDTVKNSAYNKETNILIIEIDCSDVLKNLKPNFHSLKASCDSIDGVVVTAVSKQTKYDFESRYFWPWSGTDEDPVTGGTHTFLTGYWAKRLLKTTMQSFQCSQRTGYMQVQLTNDEKVLITSEAQIVLQGKIKL